MNKSNTPLIIAGVIVAWLILRRPSNVASYSSGPLGTRVNIPGIGSYSSTPFGTSVTLAQALANPLAAFFGQKTQPTGAASLPDGVNNPGAYFSPYDPNVAAGGDPSTGLLVDSGAIDPTIVYPTDPSLLGGGGASGSGLVPADLLPVDLSSGVVPA